MAKKIGGSETDIVTDLKVTSDNGCIVTGYTKSNDYDVTNKLDNLEDYWILKLNSNGVIEWQKSIDNQNSIDKSTSIDLIGTDGYIVVGNSMYDIFILKLDLLGNIIWKKQFGGSKEDLVNSVNYTKDGGFILAGATESFDGDITNNHGYFDYWILKLNEFGEIEWQKTYGGSGSDLARSISQTIDGGFIIAGTTESYDGDIANNQGFNDVWVIKLSQLGEIEWQKSFGSIDNELVTCIIQSKDEGYVFCSLVNQFGIASGNISGLKKEIDYWVVKLDKQGNIIWENCYGGNGIDKPYCIQQTKDLGFVISGSSTSNDGDAINNHGGEDYFIVKLSAEASGISDLKSNYEIFSLYPNPFKNEININSTQKIDMLEIIDIHGGRINIKTENKIDNLISIDLDNLDKGFYILELEIDTKIYKRKIIKN